MLKIGILNSKKMNIHQFVVIHCVVLTILQQYGIGEISYKGWRLLELSTYNSTEGSFPNSLRKLQDTLTDKTEIKIIEKRGDSVHVIVGPSITLNDFEVSIGKIGIKHRILYPDINRLLGVSMSRRKRSTFSNDPFDNYMNLDEMESFLTDLEKKFPNLIRRTVLGKSFEGRNISLFVIKSSNSDHVQCSSFRPLFETTKKQERNRKIRSFNFRTTPVLNTASTRNQRPYFKRNSPLMNHSVAKDSSYAPESNSSHYIININSSLLKRVQNRKLRIKPNLEKRSNEKPIIFIEAGAHSREWISPAVALYFMKKLTEKPCLTSHVEWYIMPMVNPDGYVYSWTKDRFWRKTRSKIANSECLGVDINRNFNFEWGVVDTSTNPCDEHYGGTYPGSEIETKLVMNCLRRNKGRIKGFISLHNWGQEILYPYAFSKQIQPHNEEMLRSIGRGMADSIRRSQKKFYRVGKSSSLYRASGISIDWAYDVMKIPYSFLIELRDKGLLGFTLPDSLIKPTGDDLLAALKYLASEIVKPPEHQSDLGKMG